MLKYILVCILFIFMISCVSTGTNRPIPIPVKDGMFDEPAEAQILKSLTPTALGAAIGQYTNNMTDLDRRNLGTTFQNQPSGQTRRWHNPETDIVYAITPTRTHQYTDGSMCREYVIELYQGNDIREFYGRACKQNDNSWVIVN